MPPLTPPRNAARNIDMLSALLASRPRSSAPSPNPTARGFEPLTSRLFVPRAATDVDTVPEGYGRAPFGPDGGTVAGIVLGSIAGFLILLWLIYWCVNLGNGPGRVIETGSVGGGGSASVVSRHSKPRAHRHKHSSRGSRRHSHHSSRSPGRRRETIEIRRERIVPMPVPTRDPDRDHDHDHDHIIVEEDRIRSASRPRPPMPPQPPPPPMDDTDDEVVVIEEHTPPRRRESRGNRRSEERRSGGGYRDVDPYRFAGGDAPVRDMSRRRRSSSRR